MQAILYCAIACSRGKSQDSVPSATAQLLASGPRLRLEPARLDLGAIGFEESAKGVLSIVNEGNAPLVVQRIEPSRFCTTTVENSTILSGARKPIEVVCRSDLAGPLREQLKIHTNATANAAANIDVVGNVTPILAFDVPLVLQEMPFGQAHTQDTRLVGKLATEAKLGNVTGGDAAIEISLLAGEPNRPDGLRLRCKGNKVGVHVGQMSVATGLTDPAQIQLSWSCKVQGTLEVNPTNPFFNLKRSGPWVVFIDVKSTQPGFEVRSVRVKEGPFTASVEPADAGSFRRVKVEFDDSRYREETRGANGTIVVVSNDRTEPEKEIPLFGFGKLNRFKGISP